MTDQAEQDLDFVPSDEIVEREPAGAEDDAVHTQEPEEPWLLMTVEAEGFDAEQLDEAEADEIETDAAEAAEAPLDVEEAGAADEQEPDVEDILLGHYGMVSAEPDEEPAAEPTGTAEFVCRSCFLRRHAFQLADPARRICVDCAANGA